ncbi:MAG: hypothetical protein KDD53_01285, partial [Bdellovibrionales bacterium]|nr:hypothetical protein [Bdellovibrionales bacterium]
MDLTGPTPARGSSAAETSSTKIAAALAANLPSISAEGLVAARESLKPAIDLLKRGDIRSFEALPIKNQLFAIEAVLLEAFWSDTLHPMMQQAPQALGLWSPVDRKIGPKSGMRPMSEGEFSAILGGKNPENRRRNLLFNQQQTFNFALAKFCS